MNNNLKEEIDAWTMLLSTSKRDRNIVNKGLVGVFNEVLEKVRKEERKQIIKKAEGMKKTHLYHWVSPEYEDKNENVLEGVVDNYKDAPFLADGMSCEFVWNKALSDIIKVIKEI